MSKNKKKRNKAYAGAVTTKPTIVKVAAVDRSKLSQWVFERKTMLKTGSTIIVVTMAIIIIVIEIIRAVNH